MTRIDSRLERALFAVAVAAATVVLLTVPDSGSIVTGEMLPVAVAVGVAVYASGSEDCDSCGCC